MQPRSRLRKFSPKNEDSTNGELPEVSRDCCTVRMLSRMVQNLKTRAPRETGRNQPG
jgi:hypothetical protein